MISALIGFHENNGFFFDYRLLFLGALICLTLQIISSDMTSIEKGIIENTEYRFNKLEELIVSLKDEVEEEIED